MFERQGSRLHEICTLTGKVTEGGSGRGGPDTPPFSAKERQLVQVVVSPYTCPTFVLSVAVSC